MVNIPGLVAVGLVIVSMAARGDGIEPKMRDPRLPAVKSVEIKAVAAPPRAARESVEQCGRFVLSKAEVRAYLRKAREVTRHDYLHMLDWSPCYVSGNVTFAGGVTGVWGINHLRAGSLTLRNGRIIYL
ncbi:hypothetical protein [Massilia soli]|uniref:NTF2 fold domain-containing protein n=1 Tax=Massilia soli TaxID=2792854 RepID=A0ABS7SME7_9BURK|nr:hypothetical protein [Massilia soli]MBZ2206463.1 hypothetical protein [Massilia soli]